MELYILDDSFKRSEVVDRFESLVWTERYQETGDFEINLYSTQNVRTLFNYGTMVTCNKSNRIMIVDELENKTDSDGKKILTVKGSSIEKILKDRAIAPSASTVTTNTTSILIGTCTFNTTTDVVNFTGHGLVTGDIVYFKTTGKLPGYIRKSIASTKVKISTAKEFKNCFILKDHGFTTGEEVYVTTSGTIPAPLVSGTTYYVIDSNNDTFMLATSLANSDTQTAIDITSAGTGTHTIYSRLKPDNGFVVIRVDDDNFKLAWNAEDAELAISLLFDSAPTGTHTLYWYNFGKIRVSGLPADIARFLVQSYCIDGFLSSTDVIPNLSIGNGSIYSTGTNPEPDTGFQMDIKISSVYDVVKQICELYSMGFRIIRNYETGTLLFNIYTGDNKTTSQTTIEPVVFDPSLDTLLSDTEYSSTKNLKNVAYVFAPNGFAIVYSGIADNTTSGLDKKVLYVDATDITTTPGVTLNNQLAIRGQQALNEYRTLFAFDGEVPTFGNYIYDLDYKLGDLVEVRNSDGYGDQKRVTEQIFSDDTQGEKSYPTLSSELTITPGSWVGWDTAQVWNDIPDNLDNEWQDL